MTSLVHCLCNRTVCARFDLFPFDLVRSRTFEASNLLNLFSFSHSITLSAQVIVNVVPQTRVLFIFICHFPLKSSFNRIKFVSQRLTVFYLFCECGKNVFLINCLWIFDGRWNGNAEEFDKLFKWRLQRRLFKLFTLAFVARTFHFISSYLRARCVYQ